MATLYEMIGGLNIEKKIEVICGNIDLIGETLTELNKRITALEEKEE